MKTVGVVFRVFLMCSCAVAVLSLGGCGSGGNTVRWVTDSVSLSAEDFYIEADGVRFLADVQDVEVHSDPADAGDDDCTLEMEWFEQGTEMRMNIYFREDESHWWADEIRTYDGKGSDSEWIYYTGEFFKSPLGSSFVGDLDLSSDPDEGFPGSIHLGGLEVQAFLGVD